MKLLSAIFVFCFFAQSKSANFGVSDLFNSGGTIVRGVGKEVVNVIPTPDELFKASKQVLIGLPEAAVFTTINHLCSLYMASDTIDPRITPDINSMSLILYARNRTSSYPLTQAEKILKDKDFDVNKKVALFVTGWLANPQFDYVAEMANAFKCRGGYNYLVLNSSSSIDSLYSWSAFNTEAVGQHVAVALGKMVPTVPAKNIHLIGHSLGAHIVGFTGRYFNKNTGLNISRITGLDPANPCFNEGETLSGLQRGDADFIDIIHSNPYVLGKPHPVGDADFYPEGLAPIKPGCIQLGCSHGRSYEYFTETVYPGNERNFLGVRCTSLTKLNNGFCNGPQFPMGLGVPYNLKGSYFLSVNSEKPYGQNNNQQAEGQSDRIKCKSDESNN